MSRSDVHLVVLMKAQHLYGDTHQIVAQIGYQDTSGWWQTPSFGWSQPGRQYADLQITGYVNTDDATLWGYAHCFTPHQIELDQAESIVKVLRQIKRGLARADAQHGFFPDNAFHEYIIRVTAALGIADYRVPIDNVTAVGSQHLRQVTGAGLQSWIHHQAHDITRRQAT